MRSSTRFIRLASGRPKSGSREKIDADVMQGSAAFATGCSQSDGPTSGQYSRKHKMDAEEGSSHPGGWNARAGGQSHRYPSATTATTAPSALVVQGEPGISMTTLVSRVERL